MVQSSFSAADKKRVAIIPGDGIGKEVIPAAVKVLKSAAAIGGREVVIAEFDWGADRYLRDGTTLPSDAVEMFQRDFDAILLGAMGDPVCRPTFTRRYSAGLAIQAGSLRQRASLRAYSTSVSRR